MRATVLHPLAVMLLVGSLLLAIALWRLPGAGVWSWLATWVLFWGLVGYTTLVVALLWPRAGGEESTGRQYTESDMSEASIKNQLRREAIQHPATLLALAAAMILTGYLGLLAPRGMAVTAAPAVAVGVAVGSFLWHYAFRHQRRYAARLHDLTHMLDEAKAKAELEELERLRRQLIEGFSSVDFCQGIRVLKGLEEEFSRLQLLLKDGQENAPLTIMPVPALASETYHRGLSVLSDTLELRKAVQEPDRERLQGEIVELERELLAFGDEEGHRETNLIREDTLASHRHRLAMLDQLRLRADQLLHLAGRCEASLHRTRIEVSAIRSGSSEDRVDSVVEALQETVRRAREVQEELHRLGY